MREINVETLEERARALESEVASAGLLRLLLGDSTGAATPGRYRFLHEAINERPALRRSLLDGKVKTMRSEWARALADRQSDARFLHGLAVLYREKALAGLANGNAEPHHWVIGTALWSLLLCSDKFWHYFSQARSTSRGTGERSDLELEKQEELLRESLRGILSLHFEQGSRNFAAGRYDQATVHLRCLANCQNGRDVLLAALEDQGFHFKLAFDDARLERLQTTASELLDDWCATLVREADKAAEDAEAFKRLPKGIGKNYEGGIKKLEPFINLNIPVKRVLRASLEWYNDWCYDLYLTHDLERIEELMKPACAVADQLVALCIKNLGHTPENQSLSKHFLLRGFTSGDPERAIDEYKEALSWNPANENAQKLLGESAQAVLMEQLKTAIECMERKKFTEAYQVLDSVEERATEKGEIQKARAIVCFHHGNALANDGKFRQALERGLEAQRLERDQEVIDEFVKTMEELAPEEDNLRHLRGAQEAFGEERYDQCITKARKVSARSNYLSDAHRLQSAAHFHVAIEAAQKNDRAKAEKEIRKALELNDNPEEREIISQQLEIIVEGENVRCLNEAQEAMEAEKYDNCIQLASSVSSESKYISHAHRLQSLAYFRRGIDAAKQEHFDQAEADLKKSLELNDDASERQAIQEQIDALGDAKLGGKLQHAPENGDWRTAERILRDELKKSNEARKNPHAVQEKVQGLWARLQQIKNALMGKKEEGGEGDVPEAGGRSGGSWRQRPWSPPGYRDVPATSELAHKLGSSTRRGTVELPGGAIDRVYFSVTAPLAVLPGAPFVLSVWAYLERQRKKVVERAREALGAREIYLQSKGPVHVARGAVLTVRLRLEGLTVEDPEDTILWDGEIGNATFAVRVPTDAKEGARPGLATIHIDGLQIAKIHFAVQVGAQSLSAGDLEVREERHHKAFVSYASADRDEVFARLQGIQKAAPGLDLVLDVLTLRSGQDWEQHLWKLIPMSDIFYLFWSANAKKSEWVEKEWRCALKTKGLDFIDPVPLVSPEEVPPPPELASKHFNDWVLAFMRGRGPEA